MDIAFGNLQGNFLKASEWIEKAAKEQCNLVVLPELWSTGYDLENLDQTADQDANESLSFLKKMAKQFGIDIIAGSIAKKEKDGVYNTLIAVDRNGRELKQYSKLHLFKLMDEHHFLQAGDHDGLFELYGETVCGVICYDIRFPEWIRKHVLSGAKIIFVPAEWPLPRLAHWRTLLIARAIENQCYVVACNRSGQDPNNVFAGHSLIIDPWGEVIAEADVAEELLIGEIDLDKVKEVRSMIPIFEDRRSEFY